MSYRHVESLPLSKMGSDLVKALSRPIESAVHDCAQISSESDCQSGCCSCHSRTIAPEADPDEGDEETDTEIALQTKPG